MFWWASGREDRSCLTPLYLAISSHFYRDWIMICTDGFCRFQKSELLLVLATCRDATAKVHVVITFLPPSTLLCVPSCDRPYLALTKYSFPPSSKQTVNLHRRWPPCRKWDGHSRPISEAVCVARDSLSAGCFCGASLFRSGVFHG